MPEIFEVESFLLKTTQKWEKAEEMIEIADGNVKKTHRFILVPDLLNIWNREGVAPMAQTSCSEYVENLLYAISC